MVTVDGNKIEVGAKEMYMGGHTDTCSRFAFLIEDPAVRLDISKTDHHTIIIRVHCDYKYELNIGYFMEHRYDENNRRDDDHWYQVKSIGGELKLIEYNRQIGFGEVIMMDKKIINNGTFYRLCEFDKYLV